MEDGARMRAGTAIGVAVWALVLGGFGYLYFQLYEGREAERRLREAVARLTTEERVARIYVVAVDVLWCGV
jgi:hypothetical protein